MRTGDQGRRIILIGATWVMIDVRTNFITKFLHTFLEREMSIENLGECLHKGSYTPGSVFAHKFGYSSISTPSYVSASSVIGCCIHKY